MHKNNFDTSSTGTSIELSCFYEDDMARHYFDENFSLVRHESYYHTAMYYYTAWGNVEDHENLTFELHGTKAEMIRWLKAHTNGTCTRYSKQDCIEAVDAELYEDTVDLSTYEGINKQMFDGYKLEYKPSKMVEKVLVRGHGQSDAAYVFYCPEDLEKVWGKAPDDTLYSTLRQIMYDVPIYALFTINEDEYYYTESVDNEYEWEPEKFAQDVAEASGVPYETLFNMLPKYPN